jgi:hypothetical protein
LCNQLLKNVKCDIFNAKASLFGFLTSALEASVSMTHNLYTKTSHCINSDPNSETIPTEKRINWIGRSCPLGLDGWNYFLCFGDLTKSSKENRVRHLIWLATTWSLWKLHNNVIFNGITPNLSKLVDDIKAIFWIWFSGRFGSNSSCLFFF